MMIIPYICTSPFHSHFKMGGTEGLSVWKAGDVVSDGVRRKAGQSHTKFVAIVMTRAILLDVLRKDTTPVPTRNSNVPDFWLAQICIHLHSCDCGAEVKKSDDTTAGKNLKAGVIEWRTAILAQTGVVFKLYELLGVDAWIEAHLRASSSLISCSHGCGFRCCLINTVTLWPRLWQSNGELWMLGALLILVFQITHADLEKYAWR